jgi:hypothetical protein
MASENSLSSGGNNTAAWSGRRHHTLLLIMLLLLVCLWSSFLVPIVTAGPSSTATSRVPTELLTHVTFASCNRQRDDQSFWMQTIAPTLAQESNSTTPHTDLLLWLGNAVYADVDASGVAMRKARTPEGIEKEYIALTKNQYYRQFVEEVVEAGGGRVVGIWDDRDLGLRFADRNYSQSEAVRRLYVNHLWHGYPQSIKDSTGEGANGALYSFTVVPAPAGSPLARHFVNSVCTLTLDVRTQRSALPNLADTLLRSTAEDGLRMYGRRGKQLQNQIAKLHAAHAEVMAADLLGAAQWAWLERVISTYLAADAVSPGDEAGRAHCAVTLIASPWQVLLNDNKPFEGWDLYPGSRSKLLLLLKKYGVARIVFLSGHAEFGEVGLVRRAAKADYMASGPTASIMNAYPVQPMTKAAARLLPPLPSYLVEVTTGGLTHATQEAPLAGWLTNWLTTPRVAEDRKENGFVKRYVLLTRTTASQRNFGTLQVRGEATTTAAPASSASTTKEVVLQRTRVVLTLYSTADGASLAIYESSLEGLPSFNVEPLLNEVNEREEEETKELDLHNVAHLPVFTTFNVPGDIPWLKRRLAERQCAEVPCANGQHYALLKVVATLALAFVAILAFIAAFYMFQRANPQLFEERAPKLKQD